MKISPSVIALFVALAVFLVAPYLPSALLKGTVGTRIGAAAVLGAVLYVGRTVMTLGLAAFLAAAALFLEQRRRIVEKIQLKIASQKTGSPGSVADLSKPAPPLIPGEIHPDHSEPEVQDHGYEPEEGSGSNSFKPVGESIDEKHALPTVRPDSESIGELMQEKGLAPQH
jgi:hypothetical protein